MTETRISPAAAGAAAAPRSRSGVRAGPGPAARAWPWAALFVLYALAGLRGYGVDQDTYRILRSGRDLLLNGFYLPSRFQGSLVSELAIGAASIAGGHVLSNAVSALLGTLTLVLLHGMLRERMEGWQATGAVAIIAVNPWYVIASSSSMDYVYGLFFLVLGVLLICRGTMGAALGAGLVFALAASARFSLAPVIAAVYLLCLLHARSSRGRVRVVASGALAGVGGLLLYVPVWLARGRTFGFLGYAIGEWTPMQYLVRFGYKSVFLWGLLPAMVLAAGVVRALRRRSHVADDRWLGAGLLLIGVAELLFLKVPLEISYLLPVLLVAVPLWVAYVGSRAWTAALFALTLSYNVVSLDVLRIDYGGLDPRAAYEAVAARPELHLKSGVLRADLRDRPAGERSMRQLPPRTPPRTPDTRSGKRRGLTQSQQS